MTAVRFFGAASPTSISLSTRITSRAFKKCRLRPIAFFAKRWRHWHVPDFELFGTRSCPYTQEMREWLEWKGHEYVEYDVELDAGARGRMIALSGGQRTVPVLVEKGAVKQVGWQGRGCVVSK